MNSTFLCGSKGMLHAALMSKKNQRVSVSASQVTAASKPNE